MAKPTPITFADTQPTLPGNDFVERLQDLRIARLFAANSNERDKETKHAQAIPHQARQVSMVEREQPFPAPRPSPDFAADIDAVSFDARWEAERNRATIQSPQPQTGEQAMSDDTNTPRRPQETLREGHLKAAIWRNEGENGAYHSVTVARTYKDQDGNLQDTQSFRAKDMLGLSELARRAHHDVHDLDRAAFKEQRREGQEKGRSKSLGPSR